MRNILIPAVAVLFLAGCADGGPFEPVDATLSAADAHADAGQAAAGGAPVVDIDGRWRQQRELFIQLADWAAPMFGITPEGNRTTLRCSLVGTVVITQSGASFTATSNEQGHCSTPGGQTIMVGGVSPMEGTISGRNFSALAYGNPGPVECPQRGSIRVENGVAVEISGTAHCIEPGHPQSLVQVPLPRAGPNQTRWSMTR